ncbi:MAG: cytochrome c, partial [Betaproteobacteria bacterium]
SLAAMKVIAIAALAAAALVACAANQALSPVEPPARSEFDARLIAKGATLAAIGNCNSCHTAESGKPYAGGRALLTPFGTMYGTNITPDLETGIGRWSETAFRRAMHEGLDREGRHLYPAFPYDHFTKVNDEDIRALYAFVMTREPVRAVNRPHLLAFPFNVRSLIGVWKRLYFEPGRFQPEPGRSAEFNRGAYLAEGLAHCGACHTPRNALGAEKKRMLYAGGEAEGWHGPALNADSPAPLPWNAQQLYTYLRTGLDEQHAIAAGPMDPVVRNLALAPEAEVRAIAAYFAAMMGEPAGERYTRAGEALALARRGRLDGNGSRSAALYAGACGHCHDQGRQASNGTALHLALGTAMTLPTSKNLVRITLEGIAPPPNEPGRTMPGFAQALTDAQVKELVAYIRERFGRAPPWTDVDDELRKARQGK